MYRFAHPQYPELWLPTLSVRFARGFYETDDAGLAERLSLIDGVVLLDESPASVTPSENAEAVPDHEPSLAELEAELAALRAEVDAEHTTGAD